MDYGTYSAASVQLAVDVANTDPDDPRGPGALVAAHDAWFADGVPRTLGPADRRVLARLAREVRAVAGAGSDREAGDALNRMLEHAVPVPRVTDHDGVLHVHYSADDTPLVRQLAATVAMAITSLVCRDGRERLGICAAADCADVFVDTSRNRSRRYCSETCSSRTTVSAYRARRRATAPADPGGPPPV